MAARVPRRGLIALVVFCSFFFFRGTSRWPRAFFTWRLCAGKQVPDSSEMAATAPFHLLIVDLISQAAVSAVRRRRLEFSESSEFIAAGQTNTTAGRRVPGGLRRNAVALTRSSLLWTSVLCYAVRVEAFICVIFFCRSSALSVISGCCSETF